MARDVEPGRGEPDSSRRAADGRSAPLEMVRRVRWHIRVGSKGPHAHHQGRSFDSSSISSNWSMTRVGVGAPHLAGGDGGLCRSFLGYGIGPASLAARQRETDGLIVHAPIER